MKIDVLQIIWKLFDMKIFIMKIFHLNKKLITVYISDKLFYPLQTQGFYYT